jgi:hypothetical protein
MSSDVASMSDSTAIVVVESRGDLFRCGPLDQFIASLHRYCPNNLEEVGQHAVMIHLRQAIRPNYLSYILRDNCVGWRFTPSDRGSFEIAPDHARNPVFPIVSAAILDGSIKTKICCEGITLAQRYTVKVNSRTNSRIERGPIDFHHFIAVNVRRRVIKPIVSKRNGRSEPIPKSVRYLRAFSKTCNKIVCRCGVTKELGPTWPWNIGIDKI